METGRTESASVIERGQNAGRLSLDGHDLHAGEPIDLWLVDLGWMPARVEFDPRMGWVAYIREACQSGEASVVAFLREGLRARRP